MNVVLFSINIGVDLYTRSTYTPDNTVQVDCELQTNKETSELPEFRQGFPAQSLMFSSHFGPV